MKNILIIGGTGTISLPIAEKLARKKDVCLYVLNRGSKKDALPENVNSIICDMNNWDKMEEVLKPYEFDAVCNFIIYNKEQAENNIKLFKNKTKQFFHISTVVACDHDSSCICNEGMPLGNRYSAYGREKETVEGVFMEAFEKEQFPATIVRPTQTYSKDRIPLSVKGNTCWSVISRMLRGKEVIVHGDGQSVWASTHADDFALGFTGLLAQEGRAGEIYHIMNKEPHTWDMVYRILSGLLNVAYKPVYISSEILKKSKKYDLLSSIRGDKHYSNVFDTSKIETAVPEFQCRISIDDGLKRYLGYMDKNPHLKVEDPEFDLWCDETITAYKKAMETLEIE